MAMRFGTLCLLVVCASSLAGLAAVGCAAPDVSGSGYKRNAAYGDDDDDTSTKTTLDAGTTDTTVEDDTTTPPPTNTDGTTPTTPPTPIKDADNDGIADDVDCAPNDAAIVGTKLAIDDLTADRAVFEPAAGFGTTWSYSAGYRQTRLANAPDQTLLKKDAVVTDATVEIIGASTEIGSVGTPTLRQMFVTFGTKLNGTNLSAVACGVEVDGTQTVTQKTTVAALSGNPTNVTTTVLGRVDREAVQVNEEFKINAAVKAGVLTCKVTVKGVTTTATATVGNIPGSVGLFTRQTKALFRQITACKLK